MRSRHYIDGYKLLDGGISLAAIAKAIAILKSIASGLSEANNARQIRRMNRLLNEVVRLQLSILEEIQELKVYIRQEIKAGFIHDRTVDIGSYADSYQTLIAKFGDDDAIELDEALRRSLTELEVRVRETTYALRRYGAAAYAGVAMGTYLQKSLFDLLQVDTGHRRVFFDTIIQSTDEWLDLDDEDSIGSGLVRAETKRDESAEELLRLRGSHNIGSVGSSGTETCSGNMYLDIDGDLEEGFTVKLNRSHYECSPRHESPGGGKHDRILDDREMLDEAAMNVLIEAVASTSSQMIASLGLPESDSKQLTSVQKLSRWQRNQINITNRVNSLWTNYIEGRDDAVLLTAIKNSIIDIAGNSETWRE